MKSKLVLLVAIAITITPLVGGCGTPKVGPAKTTLDPMKGVGQVRSVRRTTVVSSTGTNITMVELDETPTAAQKELRLAELKGNRDVAVAHARPSVANTYTPATYGGYGYYSGGFVAPHVPSGYYPPGGSYGLAGYNYNFSTR